jgi:hypothetical protein
MIKERRYYSDIGIISPLKLTHKEFAYPYLSLNLAITEICINLIKSSILIIYNFIIINMLFE